MMSIKIVFTLALVFTATYALPSSEDIVPEDVLAPPTVDIQTGIHAEAESYLKANGDDACKSLADATEKEVKDNVEAQQAILNKIDTGAKCPQEGQDTVNAAQGQLKNAEDAKKKADSKYDDALNANVSFGDHKFNSLTKGNCNTFFNSAAYKEAEQRVNNAKNAKSEAAGKVTQAKSSLQAAKDAAKTAVKKCQCAAYKNHESSLKGANKKVTDANTKAWTKAAHLKCVLAGKTTKNCNVPTLPTVNSVSLASGVNSQACGSWVAEKTFNAVSGGSHNKKKFKLYLMKARTGFDNNSNGMHKYEQICYSAGLKTVGCGSNPYDSSGYAKAIAMPNGWGCNMMGSLSSQTGWKSVVAYQEKPGAGAALYTDNGQPHSGRTLSAVCGSHW